MTIETANLFNSASQFVKKLFASDVDTNAGAGDLWQLYRMSRGVDSVGAGVTRKLDRMANQDAN